MAVAAENGAPKTELQELQMKSNQVTDEVTCHPFSSFLLLPSFWCNALNMFGKRWVSFRRLFPNSNPETRTFFLELFCWVRCRSSDAIHLSLQHAPTPKCVAVIPLSCLCLLVFDSWFCSVWFRPVPPPPPPAAWDALGVTTTAHESSIDTAQHIGYRSPCTRRNDAAPSWKRRGRMLP